MQVIGLETPAPVSRVAFPVTGFPPAAVSLVGAIGRLAIAARGRRAIAAESSGGRNPPRDHMDLGEARSSHRRESRLGIALAVDQSVRSVSAAMAQ